MDHRLRNLETATGFSVLAAGRGGRSADRPRSDVVLRPDDEETREAESTS